MARATNAQLARRRFEEVRNRRTESTVHELLAPNMVGHMEGLEVRSPADFVQARAALRDGLPDPTVTVEAVVAEGDDAVVRWSATGTRRRAGPGLAPSRRRVTFRGMSWMVFSEGRIVEGWDSWNQGLLMQEPGARAANAERAGSA